MVGEDFAGAEDVGFVSLGGFKVGYFTKVFIVPIDHFVCTVDIIQILDTVCFFKSLWDFQLLNFFFFNFTINFFGLF